MVNKKRTLQAIISAVLFIVVGVLLIALAPSKVKADYVEPKPMIPISYGIDKPYQFFQTGYDTNYSKTYTYIDFRTASPGSSWAYEVISLGSDNGHINTVMVSMVTNASNMSYFFNGNHAIECGFYSGNVGSINYDSINLPYFIPRDYFVIANQNSMVTCYVDVSDLNVYAEGNVYFIVRYTEIYRQAYVTNYRPSVMLFDLQTNVDFNNWFTESYELGLRAGRESGLSDGYNQGEYYGYLRGLSESSQDYGIRDLLFSVLDAPLEVLTNVFSFNLLGVEVWHVIVSLIVISLVIFIIKRIFFR